MTPERAPARSDGTYFYLAACLWAAAAVPLWVASFLGFLPSGLSAPQHGHDMLAGYALAVVAGFLLARLGRGLVRLCLCLWLAARLSDLLGLPPVTGTVFGLALPVAIFSYAGIPFLRSAKSGTNRALGPIIGLFCCAELLYRAGTLGVLQDGVAIGNRLLLDAITALLFVMGGRILSAAVSGAMARAGRRGQVPRRAWLEWIGLAGLAAAFAGPVEPTALVATGHAVAGLAAAARVIGWCRLPALRRPEIGLVLLGYAWLAGGEMLRGASGFFDLPPMAGIHAVTVGGLGILATMVIARITVQDSRGARRFGRRPIAVAASLSIAAALRVIASLSGGVWPLAVAAAAWSIGHLIMVDFLLRHRTEPAPVPLPAAADGRTSVLPAPERR